MLVCCCPYLARTNCIAPAVNCMPRLFTLTVVLIMSSQSNRLTFCSCHTCLHTSIVNCQRHVRLACNVAGVLPGAGTNLVHLGHFICKKESLTNGGRHCRNATNELCTTCRVHMKCCCIHDALIVDASLSYCYCREKDIIDKQQRNLFKACRHAQEPVGKCAIGICGSSSLEPEGQGQGINELRETKEYIRHACGTITWCMVKRR